VPRERLGSPKRVRLLLALEDVALRIHRSLAFLACVRGAEAPTLGARIVNGVRSQNALLQVRAGTRCRG